MDSTKHACRYCRWFGGELAEPTVTAHLFTQHITCYQSASGGNNKDAAAVAAQYLLTATNNYYRYIYPLSGSNQRHSNQSFFRCHLGNKWHFTLLAVFKKICHVQIFGHNKTAQPTSSRYFSLILRDDADQSPAAGLPGYRPDNGPCCSHIYARPYTALHAMSVSLTNV